MRSSPLPSPHALASQLAQHVFVRRRSRSWRSLTRNVMSEPPSPFGPVLSDKTPKKVGRSSYFRFGDAG